MERGLFKGGLLERGLFKGGLLVRALLERVPFEGGLFEGDLLATCCSLRVRRITTRGRCVQSSARMD